MRAGVRLFGIRLACAVTHREVEPYDQERANLHCVKYCYIDIKLLALLNASTGRPTQLSTATVKQISDRSFFVAPPKDGRWNFIIP